MSKWTRILLTVFISVLLFSSCKKAVNPLKDNNKPQRKLITYFDQKYLLYQLPANYYENEPLNASYSSDKSSIDLLNGAVHIDFQPMGYSDSLNLQYSHIYSDKCVYHIHDSMWTYAEVCFPNTCLTKDYVYAKAAVKNTSAQIKTVYLRLFYQNTSYWYPTDSTQSEGRGYLDNYYGCSEAIAVNLAANSDTVINIPYSIGMNPKHEFDFDPSKDPARPGNYEFMLYATTSGDALTSAALDLKNVNPFIEIRTNKNTTERNFSYVGPHHFKFVFLDEYFDGVNDLDPTHVFVAKHGREKKLCDTCSGWYRSLISEHWNTKDFFEGFIIKAPFVKGNYGIRRENCKIDSTGITITIPASKRGDYNKTWGEFLFGPAFKYGHLTIRAKFAQMHNTSGSPNGIIHNLWLYQRDPDAVDTSNPYALVNSEGKQPYEIDFEFWTCQDGVNSMWDDQAFINASIVDYMRNPNVSLKPGDTLTVGRYRANRFNKLSASMPGGNIPREFFNDFHTYELFWYPDHVRFTVDGYEFAVITNAIASIPDKSMFLWVGSPLYQDGTYFRQSNIPFLKYDKHTVIDYIKIE